MKQLIHRLNSFGIIQPGINILADILSNPLAPFLNLCTDLRLTKKYPHTSGHKICVAGLPKSGTTLVEEILRFNDYLDLSHTSIRRSPRFGISEPENQLPQNLFKFCSFSDRVFVKTHINASLQNLQIIASEKIELLVVIRDLREMMISRYFHIMSSPRNPRHNLLAELPEKEGLFRSMINPVDGVVPLEYFASWIVGWLHVAPDRVISYEQFSADAEKYIGFITAHLKVRKSVLDNLRHIREHNANLKSRTLRQNLSLRGRQRSTFRPAGPRGWNNLFSDQLKEEFKRRAQSCLVLSGYEKDANW
jgi:hypothetical protein